MLNAIIIDKQENTKELISSYLKNIEQIKDFSFQESFSSLLNSDCNLNAIDLIIFDVSSSCADETINEIKKIKNKFSNIEFIAISYEINSELVSKILKENVQEFLLKPIIPSILENAIKKVVDIKNNVQLQKANTICVFSNKGGVGKTSMAVNLAYELSNIDEQKKVCLLDLNFNSEDIATFLNMQTSNTIEGVIANIESKNNSNMFSLMNNYRNSNLYVFTFQDELNPNSKIAYQGILKIINALKNIFQYIIIDTSSILDETMISILNSSDLILLLGIANLASIRNCQKCYELFNNMNLNKNKVKLILNRYIQNSEIPITDIQTTIGAEVFYKIPNNYLALIDAINLGCTVLESNPQSNIAKAYKNLAQEINSIDFSSLENQENKVSYNHGIYNLLRRMGG